MKYLIAFVMIVAASGCASTHYTTEFPADEWTGTMSIRFVESVDEVSRLCRQRNTYAWGCAYVRSEPYDSCRVVMLRPRGFEDADAMVTLGHEVYHCMGAKH